MAYREHNSVIIFDGSQMRHSVEAARNDSITAGELKRRLASVPDGAQIVIERNDRFIGLGASAMYYKNDNGEWEEW